MSLAVEQWTHQQWGVFVAVVAAGLLAALLAPVAVRARADVRRMDATRYPRRGMTVPDAGLRLAMSPSGEAYWADDVEAHVAPGPGSLASLREVGRGELTAADPLVDPEIAAEFAHVFDRPACPATGDGGGVLVGWQVAVEPAMRTARLWMLQGGESYAANALRTWHLIEQTAEYPLVRAA